MVSKLGSSGRVRGDALGMKLSAYVRGRSQLANKSARKLEYADVYPGYYRSDTCARRVWADEFIVAGLNGAGRRLRMA